MPNGHSDRTDFDLFTFLDNSLETSDNLGNGLDWIIISFLYSGVTVFKKENSLRFPVTWTWVKWAYIYYPLDCLFLKVCSGSIKSFDTNDKII